MDQCKLMFLMEHLFKWIDMLYWSRYNQDLSSTFSHYHRCYELKELPICNSNAYQNSELSILNLLLLICGLIGAGQHPLLPARRRFCKSLVPKEPHLGGELVWMPNDSLDSKSDELSIELLLVIMSSSFSTEPKTLVGKMSRLALLKNNYYFLSQYS